MFSIFSRNLTASFVNAIISGLRGVANGLASLDAGARVPILEQLGSVVITDQNYEVAPGVGLVVCTSAVPRTITFRDPSEYTPYRKMSIKNIGSSAVQVSSIAFPEIVWSVGSGKLVTVYSSGSALYDWGVGMALTANVAVSAGEAVKATKIWVSADDDEFNYLENKLVAGSGIALATLNPGVIETIEISSTVDSVTNATNAVNAQKCKVSSDDTTYNYLENKLVAGNNVTLTVQNPAGNENIKIDMTTSAVVPVGMITPYAGTAEPTGWLFCYGQAVSRTTYAALFAILTTNFGAGDGATTFNLPDLRGRAAFGRDNMGGVAASRVTVGESGIVGSLLGSSGGVETHLLALAEMRQHLHSFTSGPDAGHAHGVYISNGAGVPADPDYVVVSDSTTAVTNNLTVAGGVHTHAGNTNNYGGSTAHQNMPPTIILNYMIKY